jgi:hypothetical protein
MIESNHLQLLEAVMPVLQIPNMKTICAGGVAQKGTGYASLWALVYVLQPDVLQGVCLGKQAPFTR